MDESGICHLGTQEPPNDPMIYNRRQADGTFRSVAGFWEREVEVEPEERDTTSIAGKFAEVLGCLEDALCWLGQVNEQDEADEIRLVVYYGPPPRNPVIRFWIESDKAEEELRGVLRRLQRVEPLAPKDTEPVKEEEQ